MTDRPDIPLNALRAFEVAARQGSFTRAAIELRVTQAAVSHQIARLEDHLGTTLFRRTSDGLVLTDAAQTLFPVMERSLEEIARALDHVSGRHSYEVLNLGVVTTFATRWLIPQLDAFRRDHPQIEVRVSTHNNRVEIAREGLDAAIRFGNGRWAGLQSFAICPAPMTLLCAPALSIETVMDLRRHVLLRSYRADEWHRWFGEIGEPCPPLNGPVLDSSLALADLAEQGAGVALLPLPMFEDMLQRRRLVRPFAPTVNLGQYWLTVPDDRRATPATKTLLDWMVKQFA